MTKLKRIPFHPLLFCLYPVLALLANNIREVNPAVVTRPLLLVFLLAIILMLATRPFFEDIHRAAAVSSFLALIILSYGHIYNLIHDPNVLGVSLGRHRYFAPLVAGIVLLGIWWIRRKLAQAEALTWTLNFVALVILLFPIYQITNFQIRSLTARSRTKSDQSMHRNDIEGLGIPAGETLPDVYYIILDGYGRDDVLETYFDLDNTPFLEVLEDLGFYIPRCSRSNYGMTALSLTSSLNMVYIEDIDVDLSRADLSSFGEFSHHSAVRGIFENLGYKIVAFESGYYVTEWKDSDLYYSIHASTPRLTSGLNPFESLFLDGTIAKIIIDFQFALPDEVSLFLNSAYTEHRERILFTLEKIEELARDEDPKFVMAHIIAPHEPFVFGPDGEFVTQTETFSLKEDIFRTDREDYFIGYRGQLLYLNTRVEQLVRTLISQSSRPPIIILQGDHGPLGGYMTSKDARMSIFNAYYLPDGRSDTLYPSISPVNSFRVILNTYFGGNFEILEDVAFSSEYGHSFEFTIMPETRDICIED